MSTPLTMKSTCEEVYNYIEDVFYMRNEEDNPYPVDLDDVYQLGFYTRDEAIACLLDDHWVRDAHYVCDIEDPTTMNEHGHYAGKFHLCIGCMAHFIMARHRPTWYMYEGIHKFKNLIDSTLI